jgi:hypothetical protein
MSAKPTAGPYFVTNSLEVMSFQHKSKPVTIAKFLDGWTGARKAKANAHAWVDGMAAMEKIAPSWKSVR